MTPPTQTCEERDKLHAEWLLSGRTIKIQYWSELSGWVDRIGSPYWDEGSIYRRTPNRRTVPLGPEDIKPGTVLKVGEENPAWAMVINVSGLTVMVARFYDGEHLTRMAFEFLKDNDWLYSTDGVTWKKCEKEVDR